MEGYNKNAFLKNIQILQLLILKIFYLINHFNLILQL